MSKFLIWSQVGVYVLGPSGEVKFANEAWSRLLGMTDFSGTKPWRMHIHPDDLEDADAQWQSLVQGNPQINYEWRVLVPDPQMSEKEPKTRYLRSSCFPELDDDGNMKTVTGVMMDISVHRAHEQATAERLQDALEAKRAQENFMGGSPSTAYSLRGSRQYALEVELTLDRYGIPRDAKPIERHPSVC